MKTEKKMHKNDDDLRLLIERFLDGDTTLAEEKALREFFTSSRELPADLSPYREMFGWYAAIDKSENALPSPELKPAPRRRRLMASLKKATWAAAVVTLFIGAGKSFLSYREQMNEYALYEGSYVIRDGKKITDLRLIIDEVKEADRYANDEVYRQVLENIPDPEVRQYIATEIFGEQP